MFPFDLFRSLLPTHNPVGFGAADFVEISFAAAVLLLYTMGPAFRQLSRHPRWCFALLTVLPVALRLALLPCHPIPVPSGADDFSYLLLGDTLAHLRFANPVHPMHRFFEAVFILQEPAYSSIYPVGQGLVLAFGQQFFGIPWAGVALSCGLFCALVYWMLRGWTTPHWALIGGFLAVCEFGPLSSWMNLYWGGALSGAAGCLIFGAIPRLRRNPGIRDAAILGMGLAVQVLTRPFESLLLIPVVILAFSGKIGWPAQSYAKWKAAVAISSCIVQAVALTLFQDHQVTKSWATLPYQLSRYQYGVPATFTVQPNPVPHRPLTPEQQLDYDAQCAIHGSGHESLLSFLQRLADRFRFQRFFLLPPLYLSMPFFLWRLRDPRYIWVAGTLLLLLIGSNFYPYFYPHYLAAAACLFLLIAVASLEQMSKYSPGRHAARLILVACAAHFCFWYGIHASGHNTPPDSEPWYFMNSPDPENRATINRRLEGFPGQQLVFVRYSPQHKFHEWIHNAADIDGARIVWAGDLGGAENDQLRRYYPHRTAWLLEPDARPPRLTPYESAGGRYN